MSLLLEAPPAFLERHSVTSWPFLPHQLQVNAKRLGQLLQLCFDVTCLQNLQAFSVEEAEEEEEEEVEEEEEEASVEDEPLAPFLL